MTPERIRSRTKNERGQAMVELALVLPILCVLILGIVQFGLVFHNYLTITDAARVGARKAVVVRLGAGTVSDATAAARAAAGDLDQAKLEVSVLSTSWTQPGSEVVVTTRYPYEINLLGWVVASGMVSSTTKERLE